MNIVFFVPNIKFANLALFLSNYIKVLYYYNIFHWLILLINEVKKLELIMNSLNLVLLYYKSLDKLKM